MTSLAPANTAMQKDKSENSPAKRSLSRSNKRKKTSEVTHRQTFQGSNFDKRPHTSYLLQSNAERMPWPKQPQGRAQVNPLTPVKAFTFKADCESQFLHSERDFKMTMDNYPHPNEHFMHSQNSRIEEADEFDRDEDDLLLKDDVSMHSEIVIVESPSKRKKTTKSNNPNISDVIKLLQNDPKEVGQYFYLIQPIENGPYDLQPLLELEDHEKLQDYKRFYTLSSKGITTYTNDEPVEFITLNDWINDKKNYAKIRKKTFFQKFDRWKILRLWRRKICVKKRETVSEILEEKLFILHNHFSTVILELKKSCCEMEKLNFIELTDSHEAIEKKEFVNRQDKRRNFIEDRIQTYARKSKEDFREGIKSILNDLKIRINSGEQKDESAKKNEEGEQKRVDLKTSESDRVYEDLGFKPNLKYGPKSSLRKECSRILRCAYLLDFITMDALTNIYLTSVKSLFDKLDILSEVEIQFDFDPSKSQFGETKKVYHHGPEPMFYLDAEFHEEPIHPSDLVEVKVKKFVPPPMGNSTSRDFDPIVHIEIEDPEKEEEEIDILEESDEESKYLKRYICPTLHEIWVKLQPSKTSFIDVLEESINQGYSSLRLIERWSRNEELLKYVKVLESWDDKVCESWDQPDDNFLDCDPWLEEEELKTCQYTTIQKFMNSAFKKAEKYIFNFQPYLQKYYDNMNINFDIILDENLKNPQEVLPELLKMVNQQTEDFDNYLPETKDLGLLKINFHKIKMRLKPSPKDIFQKLGKEIPLIIRRRLNNKKQWLNEQIKSISSPAIEVDEYVRQVQALEFIDNNFQRVKDDIDLYQNIHRICSQNGINVGNEDSKLLSEVYQIVSNLGQQVMEATESIDNKKKNNIEKIKKQIPIFRKQLVEFSATIEDEKYVDINSSLSQMQTEMKKLSKE